MWSGWDRNESATESYCRSSTRRQCLMAIVSGSIAGNMFWKVLQTSCSGLSLSGKLLRTTMGGS